MTQNCEQSHSESYTTSSFPSPYNVKAPNIYVAPFIDLYINDLIDFQPNPNNADRHGDNYAGITLPHSKVFKQAYYYGFNTFGTFRPQTLPPSTPGLILFSDFPIGAVTIHFFTSETSSSKYLKPQILKKLDEKYDDGYSFTGPNLRGNCNTSDYNTAIANKWGCINFYYRIF